MADEFKAFLDREMQDPEFAAAYREAEARMDRMVQRPCAEGCCVEFYDPESGEVEAGWGPVGCPCTNP